MQFTSFEILATYITVKLTDGNELESTNRLYMRHYNTYVSEIKSPSKSYIVSLCLYAVETSYTAVYIKLRRKSHFMRKGHSTVLKLPLLYEHFRIAFAKKFCFHSHHKNFRSENFQNISNWPFL